MPETPIFYGNASKLIATVRKSLAYAGLFQLYSPSASNKVLHTGGSYSKVLLSGDVLIFLHSYIALSRIKLHFAQFESIEYLYKP